MATSHRTPHPRHHLVHFFAFHDELRREDLELLRGYEQSHFVKRSEARLHEDGVERATTSRVQVQVQLQRRVADELDAHAHEIYIIFARESALSQH